MTLEMQRLYLKEILDELSDYNRVLNDDCCKVKESCERKLVECYKILTTDQPIKASADKEYGSY